MEYPTQAMAVSIPLLFPLIHGGKLHKIPATVQGTQAVVAPVKEDPPRNVRQRTHFFPTTISARDSLYSQFEGSEMADTYRITPQGHEFMVNQNAGVTAGVYNTAQEAQVTVEDCERDDFMLRTARSLVNAAVEAHMRLHHIERRASHDWIREAAD